MVLLATSTELIRVTQGPQLIAYMLNAMLYGIALLLVLQYFVSHCRKDSLALRGVVALLGVLGTVQIVFLSIQIYISQIDRSGDIVALDMIPFELPAMLLAIYLIAFTAQCFFVSRIWIYTKRSIFYTAPIILLVLLQIAAGIAQTIFVIRLGRLSKLHTTTAITTTQSSAAAACDVAITLVLCYVLHAKNKSEIRTTNRVVNRMIVYAINRGTATSLAAILNMALWVALPGTSFFEIPLLMSSQLYIISVVSTLNTREALRDELYGDGIVDSFPSRTPTSALDKDSGSNVNSTGTRFVEMPWSVAENPDT